MRTNIFPAKWKQDLPGFENMTQDDHDSCCTKMHIKRNRYPKKGFEKNETGHEIRQKFANDFSAPSTPSQLMKLYGS